MLNSGSGCCGTCIFNELKDTQNAGGHRPRNARCTLRGLPIEQPFYRYCINHPLYNSGKVREPIGPILATGNTPYKQTVWAAAPDSPAIRVKLLKLLEGMTSRKKGTLYPSARTAFYAVVLNHLEILKEQAALPGIMRVLSAAHEEYFLQFGEPLTLQTAYVIRAAVQAALAISGGNCLDQVKHWLYAGKKTERNRFGQVKDTSEVIRLGLVEALEHCPGNGAISLLEKALRDPSPVVKRGAEAILLRQNGMVS